MNTKTNRAESKVGFMFISSFPGSYHVHIPVNPALAFSGSLPPFPPYLDPTVCLSTCMCRSPFSFLSSFHSFCKFSMNINSVAGTYETQTRLRLHLCRPQDAYSSSGALSGSVLPLSRVYLSPSASCASRDKVAFVAGLSWT